MKKNLLIAAGLIIIGVFAYFLISGSRKGVVVQPTPSPTQTVQSTATPSPSPSNPAQTVIGKSVQGRDITAYHYGGGATEILFVGGVHGGYAWNSVFLNYEIIDYLKSNPGAIPDNIKVTVIPALNPDGLFKVTGVEGRFAQSSVSPLQSVQVFGRFNANTVELNRNFDCNWKTTGVWQSTSVSGGSKAFSEPESIAIRDYVQRNNPKAVVIWDSAAGGVFSSNCNGAVMAATKTLNDVFAQASGYPSFEVFDFYEVSGDLADWLSKINIPAVTVMLSTHNVIELNQNLEGVKAVLQNYAN